LLDIPAHAHTPIYLLEEFLFFSQYKFHKQKLVLHRASMRFYADYLRGKGRTVYYISAEQLSSRASIKNFIVQHQFTEIAYTDVTDNWLEQSLRHVCERQHIERTVYSSPLFLTTPEQLTTYAQSTSQP
jgi:deoxyribodipyrimidine photolyase-related protein